MEEWWPPWQRSPREPYKSPYRKDAEASPGRPVETLPREPQPYGGGEAAEASSGRPVETLPRKSQPYGGGEAAKASPGRPVETRRRDPQPYSSTPPSRDRRDPTPRGADRPRETFVWKPFVLESTASVQEEHGVTEKIMNNIHDEAFKRKVFESGLYGALGLNPPKEGDEKETTTKDVVDSAFRKESRKYHSDVAARRKSVDPVEDQAKFELITEAKRVLADEMQKKWYDKARAKGNATGHPYLL